jgi:hypothetical protein
VSEPGSLGRGVQVGAEVEILPAHAGELGSRGQVVELSHQPRNLDERGLLRTCGDR